MNHLILSYETKAPYFTSGVFKTDSVSISDIREIYRENASTIACFRIQIVDDNRRILFSSGRIYVSGRLENTQDILQRNCAEEEILRNNILALNIKQLIHIDGESYVFDEETDVLIGEENA